MQYPKIISPRIYKLKRFHKEIMKEASFYERLDNKAVKCNLCPHNCLISNNSKGICGVRKNIDGTLYTLVYSKVSSVAIDPIEKKPLYHFYPGNKILSIGTVGCNFKCKFCQNWHISMASPEDYALDFITPQQIINLAKEKGIGLIAYTYNEPTIFYEFVIDTAKLAKKQGIKNVVVSNGFINKEPLIELLRYIDGFNIDLKSFSEDFYKNLCFGKLNNVLQTIKIINNSKAWLELTNLVIPQNNDNPSDIRALVQWIKTNVGTSVPLHFSAFYPDYKMENQEPTSKDLMLRARKIAVDEKIEFVYIGNIQTEYSNTYCPKCGSLLIKRDVYSISTKKFEKGYCQKCKTKIPGVFE